MKKLIPAICMLLVAATLMGTSTYAWFSMNTTVTATGMQVTAQSNSTFLLIKETSAVSGDTEAAKAANIQTSNPITVALAVSDDNSSVYPSKPYASADREKYPNVAASATAVTTYATANAPGNWFTANSLDPDKSTEHITGDHVLQEFGSYVIKKSVTLTIAAGADNAHNLTVNGTIVPKGLTLTAATTAEAGKTYYSNSNGIFTKQNVTVGTTNVTDMYEKTTDVSDPTTIDLTAVKVLIVTDDNNMATLTSANANSSTRLDLHGTDVTLSDSTVVVVDIFIYYDGSEANVTSNKKADLGNAAIDLTFDVEVGSAS